MAEREVGISRRPASGARNSFLYPVRRIWFATGVAFVQGVEETGFFGAKGIFMRHKNWGEFQKVFLSFGKFVLFPGNLEKIT